MTTHMIHTGIKPFKCDKCDFSTTWKQSLKNHMVRHTGIKPFKCDKCGFSSAWKKSLKNHMVRHTNDLLDLKPPDSEPEGNQGKQTAVDRPNSKIHPRTYTNSVNASDGSIGKEPFKCECGYSTTVQQTMQTHQKSLSCTRIRKHDFSTQSGRKCGAHQSLYLKKYICDSCEFSTNRKTVLDQHHLIHLDNLKKPYQCDKCDFSTNWKSSLKFHRLSHSAKKPYQCDKCDFSTNWKSSLKSHRLSHSTKKPYQCDKCDFSTAWKQSLNNHLNRHAKAISKNLVTKHLELDDDLLSNMETSETESEDDIYDCETEEDVTNEISVDIQSEEFIEPINDFVKENCDETIYGVESGETIKENKYTMELMNEDSDQWKEDSDQYEKRIGLSKNELTETLRELVEEDTRALRLHEISQESIPAIEYVCAPCGFTTLVRSLLIQHKRSHGM
jgi:uncharacterized Zn-finger protein